MSDNSAPKNPDPYICRGPFTYGTGVCLHGWNCNHTVSDAIAQHTDHLTTCGLLSDRQRIDKRDDV
jgi:hypothetical protein